MKKLTTTAVIATLFLSGPAFAKDSFFAENYKLLMRNSNPMDDGIYAQSQASAESETSIQDARRHRDFWSDNYKLLVRNSNPNDDGYIVKSASKTGAQPEEGAESTEQGLIAHQKFWAENYQLLNRNSNPNDA